MRHKRLGFSVLVIALATSLSLAQQSTAQSAKTITNQDIIEMVSAGLSDELIVDKIHAADATTFDTSTQALKALKAANVSDAVIGVMISPNPVASGATRSAADQSQPAIADPNDPSAPHDPGIYMYTGAGNSSNKMTMLEPTVYQGTAAGGAAFMFSFGIAKVKAKAVVRGAHATVKSSDGKMVFYFYFEEVNPGLSYASYDIPTTPNEFTLLKFDQKSDSRETVIMKANAFGSSTGTDEKANIGFTFTKLKPGVYKVTPTAPLAPGEYCFLSPTRIRPHEQLPVGTSRLFDFEVLPN
jgi:hypothetical protein